MSAPQETQDRPRRIYWQPADVMQRARELIQPDRRILNLESNLDAPEYDEPEEQPFDFQYADPYAYETEIWRVSMYLGGVISVMADEPAAINREITFFAHKISCYQHNDIFLRQVTELVRVNSENGSITRPYPEEIYAVMERDGIIFPPG